MHYKIIRLLKMVDKRNPYKEYQGLKKSELAVMTPETFLKKTAHG